MMRPVFQNGARLCTPQLRLAPTTPLTVALPLPLPLHTGIGARRHNSEYIPSPVMSESVGQALRGPTWRTQAGTDPLPRWGATIQNKPSGRWNDSNDTKDVVYDLQTQGARFIMMNRPHVGNALSILMAREISGRLAQLEKSEFAYWSTLKPHVAGAFSTGLDIKEVCRQWKKGNKDWIYSYFWHQAKLNYEVSHVRKHHFAILDGIVSGSGGGLAIHGRYKVACENTSFLMPSTGMGWCLDGGAAHYLSRLPGNVGTYLALTGARLKAHDLIYAGLASHFTPRLRFAALEKVMEYSRGSHEFHEFNADDLHGYSFAGVYSLGKHEITIDDAFSKDTVEDILIALERRNTPFSVHCVNQLRRKSPTSLKVVLQQIKNARTMRLGDVLRQEYNAIGNCLRGKDFHTAVQVRVKDKSQDPITWSLPLEKVTDDVVRAHLAVPEGEREMQVEGYHGFTPPRVYWGSYDLHTTEPTGY